ncbi:MAG TPA: homoserine O-acetyltransferase [Bacteroidales bacterium]|nr:homoserine O-acetyltransferase [Bacteroidales bacterium]
MTSTKLYNHTAPFSLENGEILNNLQIAYSTAGILNKEKSNVVWVCHAFTAHAQPEIWWSDLVGEGKFLTPEHYFIVCANILGSPYGSSSPLSLNPNSNSPYFRAFPEITVRDLVSAHFILADYLHIDQIQLLIGGSIGGHQALEWSIMRPRMVGHLALIATNAKISPWRIAHNATQRMIIEADESFFLDRMNGGQNGMKAARAMALLSYRNAAMYEKTQSETEFNKVKDFKADSYQRYQGEKIANRFNAYSYYSLLKMLDTHDVGRNRGGLKTALAQIKAKTLIIGITSDILFWPEEQLFLHQGIHGSELFMIQSDFGHDGFLLEYEQITTHLSRFLKGV